jgi:hypothetical protein
MLSGPRLCVRVDMSGVMPGKGRSKGVIHSKTSFSVPAHPHAKQSICGVDLPLVVCELADMQSVYPARTLPTTIILHTYTCLSHNYGSPTALALSSPMSQQGPLHMSPGWQMMAFFEEEVS